jgi:cytochrome P450
MHRSPRWWPQRRDTSEFDPWAFLNDPQPEPGAYIPFGEGPRMCLGKSLADMEALTIVSLFVRAFAISPVKDEPVRMQTLVTLRPKGGVAVRLTSRAPESSNSPNSDTELVAC